MWEVVSMKCKLCSYKNGWFCNKHELPILQCMDKCKYYSNVDTCPKCGNPATGYCYTCGVHIR